MSASVNNVVAFPNDAADPQPLLPEGEYRLAFRRYRIVSRFNRDVLELWFDVTDYGDYFGKKLARYYPIRASEKRRNFTARPGSDFVREYAKVFGRRPSFGVASLEQLEKHLVVGKVTTTTTDHRQEPLPAALHYSKIGELLRVEQ